MFAVLMQTIRTAGQKQLTQHLDPVTVTLVRYLFGLPFVLIYLLLVTENNNTPLPNFNSTFFIFATLSAIMQIAATVLLVYLFSLRNFAVGTTYARTEAFLTALVGVLFFSEIIAFAGWIGIIISVIGVVVLSLSRADIPSSPSGSGSGLFTRLWNKAAAIGLLSGLCFAICSLSLRKASLSFGINAPLLTAGLTLVTMVVMQTTVMLAYGIIKTPEKMVIMCQQWRLGLFVGLTSALGSVGWFIAMTLERASYVKALGQIEFLLALAISTFYFRERTAPIELLGMILVFIGIAILIVFA